MVLHIQPHLIKRIEITLIDDLRLRKFREEAENNQRLDL